MLQNAKNIKLAESEGWVSVFVNILLFVLKLFAGIFTGSIALIADAWHTLSDSLSSIIVIIGLKIAKKPADKEHPFGHGRSELISSLLIGGFLAVIAYTFFMEGVNQFKSKESVNYNTFAIVATIISIILKEALAQYAFWIGKKTKSKSVIADGWHHHSDAFSSVIILIGIFLGKYFWWIDALMAMIVTIMILWVAISIIRDASSTILGEEPSTEMMTEISKLANHTANRKLYAHHFHIHNYINHKELTFHVLMPGKMTITESHNIVTQIENKILNELGLVATIHIEPKKQGCND
ncbi:MAG: cation transporter [Marinilabiliaceae bacterium]|nr:cation transporter [Marinilabiliaceae bacterium]